jgi:hypothetical protein
MAMTRLTAHMHGGVGSVSGSIEQESMTDSHAHGQQHDQRQGNGELHRVWGE